jgi:hypothetical protein
VDSRLDVIRQFLDIGTGLPTANNTHEVAQAAAPPAASSRSPMPAATFPGRDLFCDRSPHLPIASDHFGARLVRFIPT